MYVLLTIYELEQFTDQYLEHLHATLSRLLMATGECSSDRRNVLATLQNIEIILHRLGATLHYNRDCNASLKGTQCLK